MNSQQQSQSHKDEPAIDIADLKDLTPVTAVRLLGRLSLGSWLGVIAITSALVAGSASIGYSYRDGTLPGLIYDIIKPDIDPREERVKSETVAEFEDGFWDLVDWQKLSAISATIAEVNPDGLDTTDAIITSLLAQVRASRNSASFLAGDRQLTLKMTLKDQHVNLEWDNLPSPVERIAQNAGYNLDAEDVSAINTRLNQAQFAYFDDAKKHAVVYKSFDGGYGLVINEN
jgi:hypothetical protein